MPKKKTQKILIPKGTINPNEDTLIEISTDFKDTPLVVANKQGGVEKSRLRNEEYEGEINRKEDFYESFAPKHHSSDENLTSMKRKYEEMQKTKKELEETAFMTANSISHHFNDITDVSRSSSKRSASNNASCQSVCPSKTQSTTSSAPSFRDSAPLTSTKKSEHHNVTVSFKTNNEEGNEENQVPEEIIEESSSKCWQPPQVEQKDQKNVPIKKKSSCRKCDKSSKEDVLVQRQSTVDDHSKDSKSPSTKYPERRIEEISEKVRTIRPLSFLEADSDDDLIRNRHKEMSKCSSGDIDYIYIEQLKRKFDEAKKKLDEAVMLASLSLKHLSSKKSTSRKSDFGTSNLCDSVPERDIAFPGRSSRLSCSVKNPCPILNDKESNSPKTREEIFKYPNHSSTCPLEKPSRRDPNSRITNKSLNVVSKVDTETQTKGKNNDAALKLNKTNSVVSNDSKCSCSSKQLKYSGSVKYVKEPSSSFRDSESILDQGSSFSCNK